MSNPSIQRTDIGLRPLQPSGAAVGGRNGPKPFDAGQAAIKSTIESRPAEAQGLHSQILAEAMDGDASEAIMRAALGAGKRDGLVDDDAASQIAEVERSQKQSRVRAAPATGQSDDARGAQQVGKKPAGARGGQVAATGRAESVAKPEMSAQSASGQHDELMMLSATMSRRDLATFVARKHATRLAAIFAGEAWQVNREAPNRLTAAQMPL
jgi:hypothetical protein